MMRASALTIVLLSLWPFYASGQQPTEDWPYHDLLQGGGRFSPLSDIDRKNVNRLRLAWHFDIDEFGPVESTPIVVKGIMYVTGAWNVLYVLKGDSGAELWRYDPHVRRSLRVHECCYGVNRGVAVYNGTVYLATLDGRLIAIDTRTGKRIWERNTFIPKLVRAGWPYAITGAPRIFKSKVIVGNSGADFGVRGYVTAYDAVTGKQAWRFFTVPGNPANGFENDAMRTAAKTWTGSWWNYGGGGTVWESMVYDSSLNLLYIGTGNGSPWNQHVRSPYGGDNLFLASIVALNLDTGAYVWHYQTTPGESWDYTATQPMILADLQIEGQLRKVLMQAPKNGFFYVLDRETGKLISAAKHTPTNWATYIDLESGRPVKNPEANFPNGKRILLQPGPAGGHGWFPMAYSPRTGLAYFGSSSNAYSYGDEADYSFQRGYMNFGTCFTCPASESENVLPVMSPSNSLVAWDPVHQQEIWRAPRDGVGGGVLATAGDLVFQATADSRLVAHDAGTGRQLWSFNTQNPGLAGPIAYGATDGQYIAVALGVGFASTIRDPVPFPRALPNVNRVLAFKLDGDDVLPPVDYTPQPLRAPPARFADPAVVELGRQAWNRPGLNRVQ